MELIEDSPYIIWDGNVIEPYHKTKYHDCMVLQDGLVSVQNLRRDIIKSGVEPIVIFSCKPGMPSFEVNFPDSGWGGLFTQSLLKMINPCISLRDLITKTNTEMKKSGLNQICEVTCRLDMLDITYLTGTHNGKKIIYLQYDMCRTPSNLGLEIKNRYCHDK